MALHNKMEDIDGNGDQVKSMLHGLGDLVAQGYPFPFIGFKVPL